MKLGIGIDTGGTYTDAVLVNFENKEILSHAKALTTKEDLSLGIGRALDSLPHPLLSQAEVISLSTTLATNACVENKGGRARLVFIGVDPAIVHTAGADYGLPPSKISFFLESQVAYSGEIMKDPDWEGFRQECKHAFSGCSAVGVVALHAMNNNAVQEKQAKEIIEKETGIPVICGHELFSDVNCLQRGASILLNARLIPVIREFLDSIHKALAERGIKAPVVIVRSDGSLMSERFCGRRPVETLLCGPAASVMGGFALTSEQEAVIVDMGGTTTDIALIQNGEPVKVKKGIRIGGWKTFVKGLFIDTFGLGGDSAVRAKNGGLLLESGRVMPLCIAASRYPAILPRLHELAAQNSRHGHPLHEFFILQKEIEYDPHYKEEEKVFCRALSCGPLCLQDAAAAAGRDIYTFQISRLEKEGVVLRAGLTPTDIMHLKGDFTAYESTASQLGATMVAESLSISVPALCDLVYFKIKQKLYSNIVRILLENTYPNYEKNGLGEDLEQLIAQNYENAPAFFSFQPKTPAVLIGIGAPIHIFLPDVAAALGTKCIIPAHAPVANALGAVIGNVSALCEIEVKPEMTSDAKMQYIVYGKESNHTFAELPQAEEEAARIAKQFAEKEARERGAVGDISVTCRIETELARVMTTDVYLGSRAIATAVGRITL